MTVANMRRNGVRAVIATCQGCGLEADVNVDALPEAIIVPEIGRCLRCSQCGSKRIDTRPAWHTTRTDFPMPRALIRCARRWRSSTPRQS
jgi:hypothetical protein